MSTVPLRTSHLPSHERPRMNVELEYRDRIRAMSVAERIQRAEVFFGWSRDYLARSIVAAQGPMSDEDLKWEVARRQYGAHPATKELINELRSRASR
jgi:hypothetical protein